MMTARATPIIAVAAAWIIGCGGSDTPSASDVTCEQWEQETAARDALRGDLFPRFREAVKAAFPEGVPGEAKDLFTDEEIRDAVDDAVESACSGEAADFKPRQAVIDKELEER